MVDGLRRLWPNLDIMVEQAGGVFRPGDFQLNFGGIPLLAAQSSYPTKTTKTAAGFEKTSGLPDTMLIRRPIFEAVLYRLLFSSSSDCIQTIQGTVTGLIPSSDMTDIRSVNVRTTGGEEKVLKDVGLVIDCTGSTQAGIKWLKSAGFISSTPDNKGRTGANSDLRISYDHKLRYVTMTFDNLGDLVRDLPIPGGFDQAGFIYTYYAHCKWGNEGFVLTRMDNTIQLCCGGWGDVHLPKEREDILPYVRSVKGAHPAPLWVVRVVEMLLESEQKGDATITFKPLKIPAPSFVQYHKITHNLPSNFIAIGDSEMQLNPLFAQGCSKALFGAMTLNTVLHNVASKELSRVPKNLSTIYFQRSHTTLEDIWTSTKAIDYGYSTTIPIKGENRAREGAIVRWYAYHAARAAETDEAVASALWHVRMLATPQVELFKPRVILGVLRWAIVNTITRN
ncbi:FAD-binding domain-containing protein [Pleurotus pulmonarius]